jgi:predicted ester cyclase
LQGRAGTVPCIADEHAGGLPDLDAVTTTIAAVAGFPAALVYLLFHCSAASGMEVDDMIAEGDKVFVLARMTGTQRGEFMGIAATGNSIDVSVCDYFRIDNGALIEHWGVMDAAGMMQQLTAH